MVWGKGQGNMFVVRPEDTSAEWFAPVNNCKHSQTFETEDIALI
jgi:hypothetical protein